MFELYIVYDPFRDSLHKALQDICCRISRGLLSYFPLSKSDIVYDEYAGVLYRRNFCIFENLFGGFLVVFLAKQGQVVIVRSS